MPRTLGNQMTYNYRPPVWRNSTGQFQVKRAFHKLKKMRKMFWSGRRDLNSGPPAPKAGALPGCATPRQLLAIDSTALLNFLSTDLAPTVHELCKLARILRHCAQSHESSKSLKNKKRF